MPTSRLLLERLHCDWRTLASGAESRDAMAAAARADNRLAAVGAGDLGELLNLMAEPDGRPQAARLFSALLRVAPEHPLLARAILEALVPGMVACARRLTWGAGAYEDPGVFLNDLVAMAYELIVDWSGQDRPYAAGDLLSALRCRMRRRILAERGRRTVPLHCDHDRSALAESLEVALAEVAADLHPDEEAALYGRVVLELSWRELAQVSGTSRRHVERLVRRADRAWCH